MKTIRCIQVELHKMFTSLPFYLCIAVTLFLCMTSLLCGDADNNEYSVGSAIFTLPRGTQMALMNCDWYNAIQRGAGSWLCLLIPIVAAIPFIPDFVDERTSGNMRMTIERVGEYRYYVVKFISCFLGGALAVLFAYLIFCLISVIGLPAPHDVEMEMLSKREMLIAFVQYAAGMFAFGGLWSMAAFLMAGIVRNKYLVLCVPFACKYIYDQYVLKNYTDVGWIRSDAVTSLVRDVETRGKVLLLAGAMAALCFASFLIIMHKRRDLGA